MNMDNQYPLQLYPIQRSTYCDSNLQQLESLQMEEPIIFQYLNEFETLINPLIWNQNSQKKILNSSGLISTLRNDILQILYTRKEKPTLFQASKAMVADHITPQFYNIMPAFKKLVNKTINDLLLFQHTDFKVVIAFFDKWHTNFYEKIISSKSSQNYKKTEKSSTKINVKRIPRTLKNASSQKNKIDCAKNIGNVQLGPKSNYRSMGKRIQSRANEKIKSFSKKKMQERQGNCPLQVIQRKNFQKIQNKRYYDSIVSSSQNDLENNNQRIHYQNVILQQGPRPSEQFPERKKEEFLEIGLSTIRYPSRLLSELLSERKILKQLEEELHFINFEECLRLESLKYN